MSSAKLSLRVKAGFGIADLGGNLFFTAMGFWALNYLTDTVALPAAAAGFAIMIGKFWDAITDPLVGFLSDRTKSKMGRRRPWILFGSIPMALSMWYFFTKPGVSGATELTVWATFALCLLNTAYTLVNIPYSALTPELTDDYHERTSLNGFRFGFAVVGTILGAAIVLPIVNALPDKASGFSAAGAVMGFIMLATALVTFFSVKEPSHETREIPAQGFLKTYLEVFRNKAFVVLILAYACNIIAINFLQGILVYYFKYVYLAESRTTAAMVILLVIAMFFIPVSVPVSKRIGKKLTYQIGLAALAATCMILFFAGHILGMNFFIAMMGLAGVGLGLTYVAPWAMVPDAIEWDAVNTGSRKEGSYYGMWTFLSKCGQAISIGASGLILGLSGYAAETTLGPKAIFAIRLILGPVPAAVFIGAILILSAYPITEKIYNEMMKKRSS